MFGQWREWGSFVWSLSVIDISEEGTSASDQAGGTGLITSGQTQVGRLARGEGEGEGEGRVDAMEGCVTG